MLRFPPRREWKTIRRPSGDHRGLKSPAESVVIWRASPPVAGITYRSALPPRSESNASHRPSGDTSTSSMVSLPVVIRLAPRIETVPRTATGLAQMLVQVLHRE